MKTFRNILLLVLLQPAANAMAETEVVEKLIKSYTSQGASSASVEQGMRLWNKTFNGKGDHSERSCVSCHTNDLTAAGKHVKTRKLIKPMAPSVNPQRLSDAKKIEKWLKRNCKWTMGRECSAQEKSDLLLYINNSQYFRKRL